MAAGQSGGEAMNGQLVRIKFRMSVCRLVAAGLGLLTIAAGIALAQPKTPSEVFFDFNINKVIHTQPSFFQVVWEKDPIALSGEALVHFEPVTVQTNVAQWAIYMVPADSTSVQPSAITAIVTWEVRDENGQTLRTGTLSDGQPLMTGDRPANKLKLLVVLRWRPDSIQTAPAPKLAIRLIGKEYP